MGAYRARGYRRRPVALIGTVTVHAALLLLMLWPHPPQPRPASGSSLAVFDTPLPPPPPETIPPPPPRIDPAPDAGGAPRPAPLPKARTAAPPPPRAPEAPVLPTALTPAAPIFADLPVSTGDRASAGVAGPAAGGLGLGGSGAGDGSAYGSGSGSGPGAAMQRAAWIVMPTRRQMEPYWPRRAIKERLSGRVVLACIVPRPGPPRRCVVAEEHPQGVGFGKAALAMIHLFRLKPVMRENTVVDVPLTIPVIFELPAFRGLPRDPAG